MPRPPHVTGESPLAAFKSGQGVKVRWRREPEVCVSPSSAQVDRCLAAGYLTPRGHFLSRPVLPCAEPTSLNTLDLSQLAGMAWR